MTVADKYDVQVAIHTDTLNEGGFLEENPQYTEGDVLYEDELSIIAIHILPCEVIVIKPRNAYEIAAVCYEIGNRHVPLALIKSV